MADDPQQVEPPHLAFEREPDLEPERRRRRPHFEPPPNRNRRRHGERLEERITRAVDQAQQQRRQLGIAPDRLMVVEFGHLDPRSRGILEQEFGAVVVEEKREQIDGQEGFRLLVQFPTASELSALRSELAHYRTGSKGTHNLTDSVRRLFFANLADVREVERSEREGERLKAEGLPETESFELDVDLWHPGEQSAAREILQALRGLCRRHGHRVTEDIKTSSLILARTTAHRLLAEELLELDLVARVDLPPRLPAAYVSLFEEIPPLDQDRRPTGEEPLVGVIDSGVVPGHPLLTDWIEDSVDFDSSEESPFDQQGHGTQVSGLAVYGDIAACLTEQVFRPMVRVVSGKVLMRDPGDEKRVCFPPGARPEKRVANAIETLHLRYGCRIFNISIGYEDQVYKGGRQFPWAEVLDDLARKLDIVIVISAGNHRPSLPASPFTREQIQQQLLDQMLDSGEQALCNPATASIPITVGAIARSDRPMTKERIAASPAGAPSVFSRVGGGYQSTATASASKPDFVSYGGNFVVRAGDDGDLDWGTNDLHISEPTLRHKFSDGRFVTAVSGTSFAAPQISHLAALSLQVAEQTLKQPPTANSARALLGACSVPPGCPPAWLKDPENSEVPDRRRLVGYGQIDKARLLRSIKNDVCLLAEEEVEADRWQILALPIPEAFLDKKGRRGLTVALAYDPPVRSSRKEYLSRTMWFEVLKGNLKPEDIEAYKAKHDGEGEAQKLPNRHKLELTPPWTALQWSTLQVRRCRWKARPKLQRCPGSLGPVLFILVGCRQRFPHTDEDLQRYAVAIRFWHEDPEAQIYQQLQQRVRVRTEARTRVRRQG